ncbi:MAG: hypothetical protein IRY83_15840, partial [Chloroflexi bacterium]|nr:hypothetical protein [Chloroflexota bacterium]
VGGLQRLAVGVIRRLGGVPIGELQRAQAALAAAQARIAELEAQAAKTKKATPDFVKANRPKKAEREPRKKRTGNFARKREPPPHARRRTRRRPVSGLRYDLARRDGALVPPGPSRADRPGRGARASVCGTALSALHPRTSPLADLGEVVVGQHRVSAATMALIATLREVGRLPVRMIPWQVETFQGVHLGVGESSEILHAVRQQAAPLVTALKAEPPASPVVHGDETG